MPGTITGNMDGDIMSSNQLPGKDIPPTYLVGYIFWFVCDFFKDLILLSMYLL